MSNYITHIVIGMIYHPPKSDDNITISHIIDNLDCMTRQHPGAGVVLTGDFNQLPDKNIRQ